MFCINLVGPNKKYHMDFILGFGFLHVPIWLYSVFYFKNLSLPIQSTLRKYFKELLTKTHGQLFFPESEIVEQILQESWKKRERKGFKWCLEVNVNDSQRCREWLTERKGFSLPLSTCRGVCTFERVWYVCMRQRPSMCGRGERAMRTSKDLIVSGCCVSEAKRTESASKKKEPTASAEASGWHTNSWALMDPLWLLGESGFVRWFCGVSFCLGKGWET